MEFQGLPCVCCLLGTSCAQLSRSLQTLSLGSAEDHCMIAHLMKSFVTDATLGRVGLINILFLAPTQWLASASKAVSIQVILAVFWPWGSVAKTLAWLL